MTEVIMVGAGGHAAEIDEYIKYSQNIACKSKYKVVGFLDDDPNSYASYKFSAPYIGSLRDYIVIEGEKYIMGIANLAYRKFFTDKFLNRGAKFISFIHCSAYISDSAIIGEGTIIGPNVNIGPNVQIGHHNLINSRCSLGHDTILGNYNFISPNTCFSGFTNIGDENLFGINSATIPGVRIGSRNKIAAGMVLDQNVLDDSVVFYRYKERVIAIPKK